MVHPARRLWKPDEASEEGRDCRLTRLEETLCGLRREADVPGYEIPSRYFHYVRTGDARPLEAVFEHNRLDLLALAMVTARAAQLLDEGPAGARTAREAYGLGRLYERAGRTIEGAACYLRADQLPGDARVRAEALRAYAVASRRLRRYEEAAGAWRRLLALARCPPAIARAATEALAVHHEHRARDLHQARRFAMQSLQFDVTSAREHATRHRLARLDRKLAQPAPALF
jgi:tetratricopeptide (TPR) repeat protein